MVRRGIALPESVIKLLLSGQKTMLRVLISPPPGVTDQVVPVDGGWVIRNAATGDRPVLCPLGHAGDELWVREAFRVVTGDSGSRIIYRSSARMRGGDWQPTATMTEEQARIRLKVTEVRAEPIGNLTEQEAEREAPYAWMRAHLEETGESFERLQSRWIERANLVSSGPKNLPTYRALYSLMWDATANRGSTTWDYDPWVWVVGFECSVQSEDRPQHPSRPASAARPVSSPPGSARTAAQAPGSSTPGSGTSAPTSPPTSATTASPSTAASGRRRLTRAMLYGGGQ